MFNNKSILITGGTGSFGQNLTQYLLKNYKPKKIIIFSRDEFKQDMMSKKFDDNNKLRFFLGDIRDKDRLILATNKVDYLVHAAALKQVPALEYNPMEAVKTNIIGAQNIIDASLFNKIKKVIALSTDKAVNPVNLYGATKLASDKLFIAANNYTGDQNTVFSVVRYGNVATSRGSVLPLFFQQKKDNKNCFTITDLKMTRFWITLNESIKFTISSFERMLGGEVFIPKLPSVKIVDIAKAIDKKYKIQIIGIRPGEKIHETLCCIEDSRETIEFKDHYIIKPSILYTKRNKNYLTNLKKEKGKFVKSNFSYDSGKNKHYLNVEDIKKFIKNVKQD